MYTTAKLDVKTVKWYFVLVMLFLTVFGGSAFGAPPVVTLNLPDNNDSTSNSFMDLSVTVSADEYP
ncbi:MAG: hypothetical protein KAR42_12075, partial [candidate division Zixibacteria bacterium]|nr:hypothetical protein [candidate division Zixibacteria bacterium]